MKGNEQFQAIPDAQAIAELQSQMQRCAKRTNIDGGVELGWGLASLLAGSTAFVVSGLPKWVWASFWSAWVGYLPLAGMCFAPYAIPRLVNRLVTWPRIGYAKNPNELKFGQLIKLMFFGLALGVSMVTVLTLGLTLQNGLSPALAHEGGWHLFSEAAKLLISAAVAIYLGRRVVTKRPPMPSAYDAAVFNKGLAQTAAGRKFLLKMKSVMLLVVIGILLVLGGIVLGAIRLATPMVHADRDWRELASSSSKSGPSPVVHADRDWRELGALTVIVGSNALFYLVINGVAIRRYKWKWILLTIMLIAPIFANAIIPEPQNGYDLGHLQGFSPVFITLGLVWFLSGAITLAAFMRQNPLPEEQMA